jgi:hypothetical protein
MTNYQGIILVYSLLPLFQVDITLGYARLYDGTVAADYYGAMAEIERRLALPEDRISAPLALGQLIALVDSLRTGALNAVQSEAVRQLRAGIAALAEREKLDLVVKVPSSDENSLTEESSLVKNAI